MELNHSLASSFLLRFANMSKTSLIKNIIKKENKVDPKYKTEICKKFQSIGKCPYGNKCRFAHGEQELIMKPKGKNYKKIPVNLSSKKDIVPMDQDVTSDIMKKIFLKLIILIIIFNYF